MPMLSINCCASGDLYKQCSINIIHKSVNDMHILYKNSKLYKILSTTWFLGRGCGCGCSFFILLLIGWVQQTLWDYLPAQGSVRGDALTTMVFECLAWYLFKLEQVENPASIALLGLMSAKLKQKLGRAQLPSACSLPSQLSMSSDNDLLLIAYLSTRLNSGVRPRP